MGLVRLYRNHGGASYFRRIAIKIGQVHSLRLSGMRRNHLPRYLITCLYLITGLMIFLAIASSGANVRLPELEIATYLLPGHSLPGAASCESRDPELHDIAYCKAVQEHGRLAYLTYDKRTS